MMSERRAEKLVLEIFHQTMDSINSRMEFIDWFFRVVVVMVVELEGKGIQIEK